MEQVHGSNSWPVYSPDRGVTAYEFVHQILRNHISEVTGEPAATTVKWRAGDAVVTDPAVTAGSVESFWRSLVESGRPRMQVGSRAEADLHWSARVKQIRLAETSMTIENRDGRTVELPLPYPVRDVTLTKDAILAVQKHVRELSIEPRQPA